MVPRGRSIPLALVDTLYARPLRRLVSVSKREPSRMSQVGRKKETPGPGTGFVLPLPRPSLISYYVQDCIPRDPCSSPLKPALDLQSR